MNLFLTLLHFGFLALTWIFVLGIVMVVRRDTSGTAIRARKSTSSKHGRAPETHHEDSAPAEVPPEPARLIPQPVIAVVGGPLTGTVLPLSRSPLLIGRSPDSSLVLDDSYASSRHAKLFFRDGYWWIEDLQSTNGTYIGGARINEPVALTPGVQVTIGKTTMELQV